MIAEILSGEKDYADEIKDGGYLSVHKNMIEELLSEGKVKSIEEAEARVTDRVNQTCKNILFNTAVFKNTEVGNKGFDKFVNKVLN